MKPQQLRTTECPERSPREHQEGRVQTPHGKQGVIEISVWRVAGSGTPIDIPMKPARRNEAIGVGHVSWISMSYRMRSDETWT